MVKYKTDLFFLAHIHINYTLHRYRVFNETCSGSLENKRLVNVSCTHLFFIVCR